MIIKNIKLIQIFILFLFLFLFFLRLEIFPANYSIDSDLYIYSSLYNNLGKGLRFVYEPLYIIINYLFSLFIEFNIFYTLYYALFYSVIIYLILKLQNFEISTKTILITTLIVWFYPIWVPLTYVILRQSFGLFFLILSGFFLVSFSLKKNIIVFLVSTLFHYSYALFIPLLIIIKYISLEKIIYFFVLSLVFYFFEYSEYFFNIFSSYLPSFFKYTTLLDKEIQIKTGFKITFFLFSNIIFLVYIINSRFRLFIKHDFHNCYLLKLYFISCSVVFIFLSNLPYYDRFLILPWFIQLVLIIKFLSLYKIVWKNENDL